MSNEMLFSLAYMDLRGVCCHKSGPRLKDGAGSAEGKAGPARIFKLTPQTPSHAYPYAPRPPKHFFSHLPSSEVYVNSPQGS